MPLNFPIIKWETLISRMGRYGRQLYKIFHEIMNLMPEDALQRFTLLAAKVPS